MTTVQHRLSSVEKSLARIETTVEAALGKDGYLTADVREIKLKISDHQLRVDRLENWQRFVNRSMLLVAVPLIAVLVQNVTGWLSQ